QKEIEMAIDPICGMTVDENTALKAELDGETHYFCSESCRKKFLSASPEPSATNTKQDCCHHGEAHPPSVQPSKSAQYYCPMCPGVESATPGDCPKCGMALEAARPSRSSGETVYTCPMHPEIEQREPGACPLCGMDLEPKTVGPEG